MYPYSDGPDEIAWFEIGCLCVVSLPFIAIIIVAICLGRI